MEHEAMIDATCTWDEEAIATAQTQAAFLEESDPEGAQLLRAQAQAVQKLAPHNAVYNPMRLYARMAKYYHFSHQDMEQMHFPVFFGYVREAEVMLEEERRAMNHPGTRPLSPQEATSFLNQNFSAGQPYSGEVVAL